MASGDTIVRVIAVPVVGLVILVCGWIAVKLLDAIVPALGVSPPGWPGTSHFYFFAALGFVGLILVLFVWLWASPVRDDVRQDVRQFR